MTDFLFANPSFLGGVATTLDLGATLTQYNTSNSPEEADAKALASDWMMVGQDIAFALSHFKVSNDEQAGK